jgi:hypothetical protein
MGALRSSQRTCREVSVLDYMTKTDTSRIGYPWAIESYNWTTPSLTCRPGWGEAQP